MPFWNEFRMLPRYCCTGYTGPTETPTYEGQLPYLGGTPPASAIDLELHPHTLNSHIPTSRVQVGPESHPEHPASVVESPEFLLLQTTRLMQFFEVPWHMLIYVYVIVKGANGDFEEANRRVLQGSYEIRTMPIWNDFSMLAPSRYCCTRYAGSTDAPTYEGQAPYIGGTAPTSAIDLGSHPHTLNSHIPATRVPLSVSLPEHSASIEVSCRCEVFGPDLMSIDGGETIMVLRRNTGEGLVFVLGHKVLSRSSSVVWSARSWGRNRKSGTHKTDSNL